MNQKTLELRTGLFAVLGAGLFAGALLLLGGGSSWLKNQNTYLARFDSVDGLIPGAKVVLSGLQVGTVNDIFIDRTSQDVSVRLAVDSKYSEWMRASTMAEISTMGVLGDKFIRLTPGSSDSELLPEGGEVQVRTGKDLSQVLNRGDQLLITLNSIAISMDRLLKGFDKGNRADQLADGLARTARNLASVSGKLDRDLDGLPLAEAVRNLNAILEKINTGKGSLGALINDPGLYDDAKALVGGANRNRIVRNLVRQTIRDGETRESGNKR